LAGAFSLVKNKLIGAVDGAFAIVGKGIVGELIEAFTTRTLGFS
jgi:hypothetical protein